MKFGKIVPEGFEMTEQSFVIVFQDGGFRCIGEFTVCCRLALIRRPIGQFLWKLIGLCLIVCLFVNSTM